MPFGGIGGGNIDIVLADKMYNYYLFIQPQERLTAKIPPVMSVFREFAKRPEPESGIWHLSSETTGKVKGLKQLTEKFCSDSLDTCIMASGNEGDKGLWVAKDMY